MNEVGIPIFILQEKRLRVGEVKEHAHYHLSKIKTLEMVFLEKFGSNWPKCGLPFPKRDCVERQCLTVTTSICGIEISSCPGSKFHTGWSELLAQMPSFFVIQLMLFPHLAFSLFTFIILPPHSSQTLMLDLYIPGYL